MSILIHDWSGKPVAKLETPNKAVSSNADKLTQLRAQYAALKARIATNPLPGDMLMKDRLQDEIERLM